MRLAVDPGVAITEVPIVVPELTQATKPVFRFSEAGPKQAPQVMITRDGGQTWHKLSDYIARGQMFRHKGRKKRGRRNYAPLTKWSF